MSDHRSSLRWSLALVVLAGGVMAVSGAAQPPAERPQPASAPGRDQPDGRAGQAGGPRPDPRNVEGAMKLINRSLRQLNAQIGDAAKKADNLRLIGDAQRGTLIAKGMEPGNTPAEGRDKYLAEFRSHQIKLMRSLLDLESHVLKDRADEARKTMEALAKYRDESHEEFKVEDDGDGKGWATPEGGK